MRAAQAGGVGGCKPAGKAIARRPKLLRHSGHRVRSTLATGSAHAHRSVVARQDAAWRLTIANTSNELVPPNEGKLLKLSNTATGVKRKGLDGDRWPLRSGVLKAGVCICRKTCAWLSPIPLQSWPRARHPVLSPNEPAAVAAAAGAHADLPAFSLRLLVKLGLGHLSR